MTLLRILVLILLPCLTSGTLIKCYKGLKYLVGQDAYQDTEDCDSFLFGDSYCYTFYEESSIQSVTKLGCSNFICNGIRNTCAETEFGNMKGKMCCCNDRHYCNNSPRLIPYLIPLLLLFFVITEVIIFLP